MEDLLYYPKEAGIYKLVCKISGKIYIGKSVNIRTRLCAHKNCKTGRYHFDNAIIKYGWENFDVSILEIFKDFDKVRDNNDLLMRESFYIELYDSTNREKGYNVCKFSTDKTGTMRGPHSEETKQKMSLASKGKPKSKAHSNHCRTANLGKKHSEGTKKKISEGNLGKEFSDETKKRMKESALKRGISKETREKMKLSRAGKPRKPHSEETKEKMRKVKRVKHAEETKQKMSMIKLGKVLSDETKDKISLGLKRAYRDGTRKNHITVDELI